MIAEIGWAFSLMAMPVGNYYIRDFRYMQYCVFAFQLLVAAPWVWTMPESPRWLLTNGRYQEAANVIRRIAKSSKINDVDSIESKLVLLKR